VPGQYCGTDAQSNLVCLQTDAAGADVTNVSVVAQVQCNDGSLWTWSMSQSGSYPISPGGTFAVSYTGSGTDQTVSNLNYSLTFVGVMTIYGSASGSTQLSHISWDQNGAHYDCYGPNLNWSALRQAVTVTGASLSASQNGPPASVFSLSGGPVYLDLTFDPVVGDHLLQTQWTTPSGQVYASGDHTLSSGTSSYSVYANIEQSGIAGTWKVTYRIDGVLRGQIYFIMQ